MPGETDLAALLAGLDPVLHDEVLVWCTVPVGSAVPDIADIAAFARIEEDEGVTLIVTAEVAERHGLGHEMPSRRIEMRIHSALEAVGLTAAMSTALAAEGISANVVAAFHHDHVLVPAADADRALAVLRGLASHAAAGAYTTILDGDIGIALRVPTEQRYPDWPLVDLHLEVRAGTVTADIESVWGIEQLDDLAAALDAIATGDLTERMVDGMRGPTMWFRSRGLVDGLWEVVVTASGSSLDSSAMIATSFDREECVAAAARVREIRAAVETDQTS